ncbi:uncharacterized protein LOC122567931 [Bombus pyrosoma]|uniref:uncharacterized protein LOC122567931 n=1 Tax=Bombus pyrosoma TaxID=396416 RepID=UPI001CB98CE5|nr:uncharacterized protein LOC122567931 [Bombus pyrosoma]
MMSTKKRSRKSDADKSSHTEQLVTWINRVRCKKLMCRRNRRRDLRIEAMLTCTLFKAENQLRIRQSSRALKWQQLKKQWLKKAKYSNYELCNDEDTENQRNLWKEPLCPELSSLDNFMSKVAEVKVPLQR